MWPVAEAIHERAVALVGHDVKDISYRRGATIAPDTLPRVTHFSPTESDDVDIPRNDCVYQLDVWDVDPKRCDELARRLADGFHHRGLTLTGRRIGEVRYQPPIIEMWDENLEAYHRIIQLLVINYAATSA